MSKLEGETHCNLGHISSETTAFGQNVHRRTCIFKRDRHIIYYVTRWVYLDSVNSKAQQGETEPNLG